jgi:hypothetical protein
VILGPIFPLARVFGMKRISLLLRKGKSWKNPFLKKRLEKLFLVPMLLGLLG